MTDRFNRNNYKILNESEQEEYFNDVKFQALYKKCLDNKDKFIKWWFMPYKEFFDVIEPDEKPIVVASLVQKKK